MVELEAGVVKAGRVVFGVGDNCRDQFDREKPVRDRSKFHLRVGSNCRKGSRLAVNRIFCCLGTGSSRNLTIPGGGSSALLVTFVFDLERSQVSQHQRDQLPQTRHKLDIGKLFGVAKMVSPEQR